MTVKNMPLVKERKLIQESFIRNTYSIMASMIPLIWGVRNESYQDRFYERISNCLNIFHSHKETWKGLGFDFIYSSLLKNSYSSHIIEGTENEIDYIEPCFHMVKEEVKENKRFHIVFRNAMWIFCHSLIKYFEDKLSIKDLRDTLIQITDLNYVENCVKNCRDNWRRRSDMYLWFMKWYGYPFSNLYKYEEDLRYG